MSNFKFVGCKNKFLHKSQFCRISSLSVTIFLEFGKVCHIVKCSFGQTWAIRTDTPCIVSVPVSFHLIFLCIVSVPQYCLTLHHNYECFFTECNVMFNVLVSCIISNDTIVSLNNVYRIDYRIVLFVDPIPSHPICITQV